MARRTRSMERERSQYERDSERRGEHNEHGRDPYTRRWEEQRHGGGAYDAGPGHELMPNASDMDRPSGRIGTFERTGESRENVVRGIRTIQDNSEHAGRSERIRRR